ncbi:MAG: Cof-type HAD-IIB family hydrolase [Allobaculum sp.]
MIKVIAVDMDGTLLNDDHQITQRTLQAIEKAQAAGLRFMIVTGRFRNGLMQTIEGKLHNVDLLLNSGAEVEDRDGNIVAKYPVAWKDVQAVHEFFKQYPDVGVKYNGFKRAAFIGTKEQLLDKALADIRVFNSGKTDEEILADTHFGPKRMMLNCSIYPDFESMKENMDDEIAKIFCFGLPAEQMVPIKEEAFTELPQLAVASSFPTNIEITSLKGQKGPALKAFIEPLGYTMDEVMVFGDSLNDLSMMEMDFATVAMANADEEIKKAAKYMTKSNQEDGVAWAIDQLLDADFCGLSARK